MIKESGIIGNETLPWSKAETNDAVVMYVLGGYCNNGKYEFLEDWEKAIELWTQVAALGSSHIHYSLGFHYEEGGGLTKSPSSTTRPRLYFVRFFLSFTVLWVVKVREGSALRHLGEFGSTIIWKWLVMNSYVRYMLKSNYCIKLKLYTVADPSRRSSWSSIVSNLRLWMNVWMNALSGITS